MAAVSGNKGSMKSGLWRYFRGSGIKIGCELAVDYLQISQSMQS